MGKILYYDCFAGISGDMHLAAMINAGVDADYLINELKKLPLSGYSIGVKNIISHGINSTQVDVQISRENSSSHPKELIYNHHSNHSHTDMLSNQPGSNRTYSQIKEIILNSTLSEKVKNMSLAIFEKVAYAESFVHQVPVDEVHFHEVGAVDSIIDIVGAAICIDFINPDKILSSPIELGSGTIHCAHGIYPVPAPATAEILKNIPVSIGKIPFEATTPTGAAIISAMVQEFKSNPSFVIEKIGYGAGHKDSDIPNVLRVLIGSGNEQSSYLNESAIVIECNIDDMNPEVYETVIENLFVAGAQDVYISPIMMKKMRPAQKISVLCKDDIRDKVITILLHNTTSLGVREYKVEKWMLHRETIEIETSLGKVRIKRAYDNDFEKFKPEYDDCIKIAKEMNMPLMQVINIIQKEMTQKL
jgi:uncharacterized protein (TIGR00299 family) protein